MRREAAEVRAAIRLRLEALGRDLGRELPPEPAQGPAREGASVGVVPPGGRHTRAVRFAVGPAQVGVVAVLVVGALAVTSWSVFGSAPTTTPVPVARTTTPSPRAPVAAPSAAPTAGAVGVVVDVTGRVRRPGIATLPAGSRVVDALRKAGGARHGVDLSGLNLARLLVDGEQIVVGSAAGAGAAPAGPSKAAPTVGSGPLVNLNTATLDQLDGLPGVGPVTAQKILTWRTAHGAFSAVNELLEVDGIGDKTLADLTPFVTL